MAKGDELQKVGRAVAARRGELGMTQQDLADAAGVDLKTVYNLESGTRWPIARTRVAIAAALQWEGDALAEMASLAPVRPAPALTFGEEDLPDDEIAPQDLELFQDLVDEFKVRLARARRRHPGERLTGALVFPRNEMHAALWDVLASHGWRADAIPRSLAAVLVMREEASSESGTAAGLGAPAIRALR